MTMKSSKSKWIILSLLSLLCVCSLTYAVNATTASGAERIAFTQDNLKFEVSKAATDQTSGEVTVTGVTQKTITAVDIPDSVTYSDLSYTVTAIRNGAFMNCSSLKEIRLPDSVSAIDTGAFWGCTSLVTINIPDGVTIISEQIFYGCESLTNIALPNGITAIGYSAFNGCASLESIVIPDSVTYIGPYAFSDCIMLSTVTMPINLEQITSYVFTNCSSLEAVTLPEGLKLIQHNAFKGCSSLKEIVIPNAVNSLGSSVFAECLSLDKVILSSTLTTIEDSLFRGCRSLETITLPEGTLSIGSSAFEGCSSLQYLHIPSSVTSIGAKAFKDCTSLSEIGLPDDITVIAPDSFAGTPIEAENSKDFFILNGILLSGSKAAGEVTIPGDVYSIASGAFMGNSNITSLHIPETVTAIGPGAFSSCTSLATVTLPNTLSTLPSSAFSNCTSLTSVVIPATVTEIGSNAFINCSSLSKIKLPVSLTTIGASAFQGCGSLSQINFPVSLTFIKENAFRQCDSLTSITIPDTVLQVGDRAFYSCASLERAIISANYIGRAAFASCPKLQRVSMTSAVYNTGHYVFMNCTGLTKVFLSKNLTCIDYYMFSGCTALTSITIPNSVEYILAGAFYNCTGLNKIFLPDDCFIDENAFVGCAEVTRLRTTTPANKGNLLDQNVHNVPAADKTFTAIQIDNALYYMSGSSNNSTDSSFDFLKRVEGQNYTTKVGTLSGYNDFILYENCIYYLSRNGTLCRFSISGGDTEKLLKKVTRFLGIADGYLYYLKSNTVYRYDLNTKESTGILVLPSDQSYQRPRSHVFELYNNRLYYITSNGLFSNIESVSLDGKQHRVVAKNLLLDAYDKEIYAAGGSIFYITKEGTLQGVDQSGRITSYSTGQIQLVHKDELYFMNSDGLYKIGADKAAELVLPSVYITPESYLTDISEDGKWMVFRNPGDDDSEVGYLYVVNSENYQVRYLADADTIFPAQLIGDYAYFYKDVDYENGPMYYVRVRYR